MKMTINFIYIFSVVKRLSTPSPKKSKGEKNNTKSKRGVKASTKSKAAKKRSTKKGSKKKTKKTQGQSRLTALFKDLGK